MNRKIAVLLVVLIVLGLDQGLKVWVKLNMAYQSEIPLIGKELLKLHFVENNGMAFGITFDGYYLSEKLGKLLLTLFRIIAVCGLGYFIKHLIDQKAKSSLIISFGLIFAGALGNIIDSTFYGLLFSEGYHGRLAEFLPPNGGYAGLFHGKVVDMFNVVLLKGHYPDWMPYIGNKRFTFFKPVFNLADVAITAGVLNIILFQRAFFRGEEVETEVVDPTTPETTETLSEPSTNPLDTSSQSK